MPAVTRPVTVPLSCGHASLHYSPFPAVGDIIYCLSCSRYVAVRQYGSHTWAPWDGDDE